MATTNPTSHNRDPEKTALENQELGNDNNDALSSNESIANPTGINEKALIRKLDLKLLPALTLLYLLSFLDRSNSKSSLFNWLFDGMAN